jgi:hypothetical protein
VVRPPIDDRLPEASPRRGAGTVALNRPPRTAPPRKPESIDTPVTPPQAPPRMPLSIVAIIAPILFADVMVAYLDQVIYALFTLLSPVTVIGTLGWSPSSTTGGPPVRVTGNSPLS